jgi:dTDP-4-amino-4,6-dideoxygalactose transaminase
MALHHRDTENTENSNESGDPRRRRKRFSTEVCGMKSSVPAIEGGCPVRDGFLVFGRPVIGEEEIAEVADSLRSGWWGQGPKVARFEEAFRQYLGAEHAVAVNSCTAAMHLSLIVAGLGSGDEVITTPMTFAATANVILHVGATPVFVDIDPATLNMDTAQVARALTEHTRALLPVHMAGRPCDMDGIREIAQSHGLVVIQDCAHAIEAEWQGRKVGHWGDLACYSFYVTKNLATAEGGMVVTDRAEWAERLRVLSLHGLSRDAWKRYTEKGFSHYTVVEPGFKYNMTDLQASLGIHQLHRIESNWRRRDEIWRRYDEASADLPLRTPAPPGAGTRHARHLYTVLLDTERLRVSRDEFATALRAENIGCGVHFVGVHLHDYYRTRFRFSPEDFPNATFVSQRTLSLPLSAGLTDQDVADVVQAVRKLALYYRR